jgi:PAS domain S-box-containing protein
MRIKKKISLGIGLLFLLILVLSVVSVEQINRLASDSENILKNNHQTLEYVKEIQIVLNEFPVSKNSFLVIEEYIEKQKKNITEEGEEVLTSKIEHKINSLKKSPTDSSILKSIQADLLKVMSLNLDAIQSKSSVASRTSVKSILWISLLGSTCFLIALLMLIKLPGNISHPIEELTESIKQIASKNYSQRVNFENHIDFGELAKSFNTMAKKLNEYNNSNLAQIISEKKITETLVNKVHDPIIGIDKNFKIIFANDEFLSTSSLTMDQIIGISVLELSTINELVSSIMIIESLQNLDDNTFNDTNRQIRLNRFGKEFYFDKEIQDISYTPLGKDEEELIGYVIILRNITKYKELDIAKTNFIATVSHEFKTPISSIKMSLQLLDNDNVGSLNNEQKKLLKGIFEDTERMLKTTSELLRMTQIESGKIQVNLSSVNIKEVMQFAINSNMRKAELKRIQIATNFPNIIPTVIADPEKTLWVLSNLISNALNYSSNNSKISISSVVNHNNVIISISDTGKGIEPQYIDRIFDKYFRIPEIQKAEEGTGLGLAICKEFIEAQGGEIMVRSKVNEGSTFSIILKRHS